MSKLNIGLIDVDSKIANLALMKLSAYHKQMGDNVGWYKHFNGTYDKVYMSKIFNFTKDFKEKITSKEIIKGGTGYDFKVCLPDGADESKPDYDIYPDNEYDIGYISRGCVRKCGFCVVPIKEGKLKQVHDPEEIYTGKHNKIKFLDNNFSALKNRNDLLKRIIKMQKEKKFTITFNQGLDIRLFDEEFLHNLSKVKYDRQIHVAFDNIKIKEKFIRGADLIIKSKIPSHRIACYVLCGFNDSIEDMLERIEIVYQKYKFSPYIMPYYNYESNDHESIQKNEFIKKLKSMVNRPSWARFKNTNPWKDFKQYALNGFNKNENVLW